MYHRDLPYAPSSNEGQMFRIINYDDETAAAFIDSLKHQVVDINARNLLGNTVLHEAAARGFHKTCKAILEFGSCHFNEKNANSQTALECAVSYNQPKSGNMLFSFHFRQWQLSCLCKPNQFIKITRRFNEGEEAFYERVRSLFRILFLIDLEYKNGKITLFEPSLVRSTSYDESRGSNRKTFDDNYVKCIKDLIDLAYLEHYKKRQNNKNRE